MQGPFDHSSDADTRGAYFSGDESMPHATLSLV